MKSAGNGHFAGFGPGRAETPHAKTILTAGGLFWQASCGPFRNMPEPPKNWKTLQSFTLRHTSLDESRSEAFPWRKQKLLLNTAIISKNNTGENMGETFFAFQRQLVVIN